jgi:hypothetical protein
MGRLRRGTVGNHRANASSRVEFPCHPLGQNMPADPLNNDIVEFRDLMVNLKAFGNRKKRNNFAPILS